MPITAGLITAGGGVLSSIFGGLFGKSAQSSANRMNIKLNRENRDWMERMSNTEWQRGVEDMKKAGMNPMLAYSQGGASSPSNSAATVMPEDAMARGVSSAFDKAVQGVSVAQGLANVKRTEAETAQIKEATRSTSARAFMDEISSGFHARVQHYNLEKTRKEIEGIISQFNLSDAQRNQIQQMLPYLIEASKTSTRATSAQAKLSEYEIPEALARSTIWERLGVEGKGAQMGGTIMKAIMQMLMNAGRD